MPIFTEKVWIGYFLCLTPRGGIPEDECQPGDCIVAKAPIVGTRDAGHIRVFPKIMVPPNHQFF